MSQTLSWHPRIIGHAAAGHFRIAIKKHPASDVWSLAVEWNENFRVLAACGEEEPLRAFVGALPKLRLHAMSETDGTIVRFRMEQPLAPEDDVLFHTSFDQDQVPTGIAGTS